MTMIRRMNLLVMTVCCILTQTVLAQPSDRMVQGTGSDLYLLHTVEPKENWYSVGRIYNISPRELAPYNHLSLDAPLSIGQRLKVPLKEVNFTQSGGRENDEVYVPLYHTVQEREWMYRISVNYNKVPIEKLEAWNGISKDDVKAGMKLIVGYLKVKSAQSSLASLGTTALKGGNAGASSNRTPETTGIRRDNAGIGTEAGRENSRDVSSQSGREIASQSRAETRQEQPVRNESIPRQEPEATRSVPIAREEPASRPRTDAPAGNPNAGESYFSSQYNSTGKRISGTAGVFKSTSGWEDKKYYALVNDVPVGTIIKISSASGDRSVYAKVLGSLAEMKDNAGLIARLSDAAASELGAESAAKLSIEIRY